MTTQRADRYLERLDAELATRTRKEAADLLESAFRAWEQLYALFINNPDHVYSDPENPAQAADYMLVLTGLRARLLWVLKASTWPSSDQEKVSQLNLSPEKDSVR